MLLHGCSHRGSEREARCLWTHRLDLTSELGAELGGTLGGVGRTRRAAGCLPSLTSHLLPLGPAAALDRDSFPSRLEAGQPETGGQADTQGPRATGHWGCLWGSWNKPGPPLGVQVKPMVKAQPASTSLWKSPPRPENQEEHVPTPPVCVRTEEGLLLTPSMPYPSPIPTSLHLRILLLFQRGGEPIFQMRRSRPEGVRSMYLQLIIPSASRRPQKIDKGVITGSW